MLHILNRLISSLIVFQVYIEFKMPLSVNSQLDNKIPISLVGNFTNNLHTLHAGH